MENGVGSESEIHDGYEYRKLVFYVNGLRIEETAIDPRTTLAAYLRNELRLTGTKIGCNEGGCGACTVMISEQNATDHNIRHFSANACLTPVCAVFGKAVTTIEGIGNARNLHPVQERLARAHGSQCGFCSPGFVMSMYTLLRNNQQPTEAEIDEALQGNLCRCTGYRPILEAFYSFADKKSHTGDIEDCTNGNISCKHNNNSNNEDSHGTVVERKQFWKLSKFNDRVQYDVSQENSFPPDLLAKPLWNKSFYMKQKGIEWFQPTTLDSVMSIKALHPDAKIICGNTELGVELKFLFKHVPVYISVKQISVLTVSRLDEANGAYFGAAVSLTAMNKLLNEYIGQLPECRSGVFRSVQKMLHRFAGKHVRDVASFAGNLATASPISDLNPIWMAADASVVLVSASKGQRTVKIDETFFVGYRRTLIAEDEIIEGIWIPLTQQNDYFESYKQAQRREDDIAIVNGAFHVRIEPITKCVISARIAIGGMARTTKLAKRTAQSLIGRKWDEATLEMAVNELSDEFRLSPGVSGGMERYRQALPQSFFLKFFVSVAKRLSVSRFHGRELFSSAHEEFVSTQIYQDVPTDQPSIDPIGRPLEHQCAIRQVTGEARFCDDIQAPGALHLALVLSPIACGQLVDVDASEALRLEGVVDYVDKRDVRQGFLIGGDTPVFVDKQISYHGQPIGAVIAKDHETARRAAHLVHVKCTAQKPIVSIEDAEAADSYLVNCLYRVHSSLLNSSDTVVESNWSKYDHVVGGSVRIGAQEHFYMETHQCLVTPGECDEISIVSSTQNIDEVQAMVSNALGVAQHKIDARVRRIGGGFGGKAHCASLFAVPTAIAAVKLRKPVKCSLERCDDMLISGTRHPFKCDYKVAIRKDGTLENVEWKLTSNCGHTMDMSIGVINRSMVHADGVYRWLNADIYGRVCKTNLASNTAFRGFGAPQSMFATETMLKHVAEECGFDVNQIREMNMYNEEGEMTPFGTHLHQCNIRRCWTECLQLSEYHNRLQTVNEFNKTHEHQKRGIYMIPTKFGIGFSVRFCNQAGALVNIYADGSVLIAHGGMEMGQGLFTKMMQVTARCLGIDVSQVHTDDSAAFTIPNASSTAASSGSDLNGRALIEACKKLNVRLEPIKKANPDQTWKQWIKKAYLERIPLSSTGFAILNQDPVDFASGRGAELFEYFVYGAACSEVEIDCLTGDHRLVRVDIVMDVGDSLNPALDIGQIEGAFIQGYGMFTMEEVKVTPNGTRLTRGPGTYKIPSTDDVPRAFNVKLLNNSSNKVGVFSSKGLGEPPLFLGSSAFFAIREAIRAFRSDHGKPDYFCMDSPATAEKIRVLCEDAIMRRVAPLPDPSEYQPWTVLM